MATSYRKISWDGSTTLKIKRDYKHTKPVYYVKITLDGENKKIKANFVPESNRYGAYFGYNIGIKVWSGSRTGGSSATIYGGQQWKWGNTPYTYNTNDDRSITIDISKMKLPIYIQPVCTGCDHKNHTIYHEFCEDGCDSYVYEIISAHTHIKNPEAPKIVKTSGTTITVEAASGCQVGEVKNDGSVSSWKKLGSNNQYTFTGTGYSNGSTHTFKARKKCDCGTYYYSGTKTAKTWKIENKTTKSKQGYFYKATCEAIHTPGTKGSEGLSDTKIHYDLYEVTYNSSGKVASRKAVGNGKTESNGTPVTFTKLTQNTNYVCVAYSTDIKNTKGAYDNKVEMKIKTATVFSVQNTNVSESDINSFNVNTHVKYNDALNVECKIDVYKYGTTTSEKTTTVSLPNNISVSTLFDDLVDGTKYTIKCTYTGYSKGYSKDESEKYTVTKTLVTSTKNAKINIENKRIAARAVKFDVSTNLSTRDYEFYKCIKIFDDDGNEVNYDNILSSMGYNGTCWSKYTEEITFESSNSGDSADAYKAKDLSYGIADDNNNGPGLLCGRRYIIYIKAEKRDDADTKIETSSTFSTWNFYLDFDILETTQNSIKCRIDVRRYDGNYTDYDKIGEEIVGTYKHIDNPSINPVTNNLYQNNSLSSYVYNATTNPNGVLNDITTESTNPEYEYRTTDINISKTKERIYKNNNCYRHIFTFSNLIYYCDHKVIVGITDGFNVITTEQYIQTEFPYIRVYTNGFNGTIVNEIIDEDDEGNTTTIEEKEVEVSAGWHKAIPYVFINDEWVPAVPLIYYKDKSWKIPNGDD